MYNKPLIIHFKFLHIIINMIKSISKCGYHSVDLLYVCTYVDCNY